MRTEEALSPSARQLQAAARIIAIQRRYAAAGVGIAGAALAGAHSFEPYRHYPERDVVDPGGGARFYYHAHPSRRCPSDEHGHFHLFADDANGGRFHHLAGLSLDARGWPIRWFTTNRWVTAEHWIDADRAIALLAKWSPRARGRLAPIAGWLRAVVELYRDTLAALLHRRDAVIGRRLLHASADQVFEDRRLDVVTETRIELPRRLAWLAGVAPPVPNHRGDPS